jgi:VanZ family protein
MTVWRNRLRSAFRILAWLTFAAIVFYTVANVRERPHLHEGANFDRFIAYAALGGLFALAYRRHVAFALCMVLLTGIGLELAQLLTPDRHARVIDAAVKTGGGVIGLLAGWVVGGIGARLAGGTRGGGETLR